MTCRPPLFGTIFLALVGLASPATAFELGVGLEVGGTGTFAQDAAQRPDGSRPANAGMVAVGGLVEERFDGDAIAFELFEDVQSPFALETGGVSGATYVPVTAGVRTGLLIGPFVPYLGVLFSAAILTQRPAGSEPLSSTIFGVGGTVGVDWVISDLRIGFEMRPLEIIGGIPAAPTQGLTPTTPSAALVLQGLFSIRLTL